MDTAILTRIFWALGLILAGLSLYFLITRLVLTRAAHAAPLTQTRGRPALLYFTTPDCAPCRTVQRPAVLRIKQALGEGLEVVEINAQDQPEMARAWGVLSVPTTFILDRSGKPLHVNHGVTTAEKLMRQLESALA
jgi:thiol-disulfide isomerase/thioredoxin